MKKALITGITGQDGAYLARLLIDKGYKVFGAARRTSEMNLDKLKFMGVEDKINFVSLELHEVTNILRTIEKIEPDEVYNLGAQSFVGASFEMPMYTSDVTAMGPLRLLEAIRTINAKIKFYQASSSEMFGKVQEVPQSEKTPFYPRSPYAVAKLFGHWMTVNYRESYSMFACSGILFNHESPLRGLEFVTRKITHAAARIKMGLQEDVRLGNLDSKRDWGYSPEYVDAMWRMLQLAEPDDFVIATGENHSVREFVEAAFSHVGFNIEWSGRGIDEKGVDRSSGRTLVRVAPEFFRPAEVDLLVGDSSKAREKLNWTPKMSFRELVAEMVEHDLKVVGGENREPVAV
ncbi:MAG: GDP-mannose 4,6-dehydratase [Thermodesulfobacteriota bacterium]|nr:MAG: GDP-mannose 4,6-dehydratase [Thermodesulfobacteriota bacterium]